MKYRCAGVILAGGLNTRFSGIDKASIRIGGKRIIDRIYAVFKDLFQEIILVTNDPNKYREWDVKLVTDLFQVRSSLTGIHAGLFYASAPHAFFIACDVPFVKEDLVCTILDQIEQDVDVVIPETSAGLEPLFAVYSKKCLKPIEQNLVQEKFKIQELLEKVRVKKIPETLLRQVDAALLSFFNVNTPGDKSKAENIILVRGPGRWHRDPTGH